jgi:bisphosphoglycerate-independent phosphoglycerate mutase (AlkP superfamily)
VETPIQITAYYTGGAKGDQAQPVSEHTPRFHDIRIENVTATGAKSAGLVMGLPEAPIRNLELKNVKIGAQTGIVVQNAQVTEQNVAITPESGDAVLRGPGATIDGR